jgi:acyl-coenzyme A synthetase/AMP-(fatty) acid ligase
MNLADIITRHAAATPFAPAVVEGARAWSYAEFDAAIWHAAAWLRAQGVAPGDVVGIMLPSGALHFVIVYALARIGAVQVTLALRESAAVREKMAQRHRVAIVIGERGDAGFRRIPLLEVDPAWLEPARARPDPALRAPGGDTPWKIAMTSGTTGTPKAVHQTHAMNAAWREISARAIPVQPDERYLAVIGLDFFAGLWVCLDVHWAGAAVVVTEPLLTPEQALETIDRHGITYLYLTPVHLHRLLPALPEDRPRLPGLRRLRTGAMVVSEELRREMLRRLTPNLLVAYGSNDAGGPLTMMTGEQLARFPNSVGFALPGIDVQVVDDAGRAAPPGETGQIRARSPGIPRAYIDNPEASARAFRDGWYYPGDLGMLSPEGALYFRGRTDDLMNYDGIKIYPSEIEEVLLAHPDVAEAAAFPVPSPDHQDVPSAAVVLRRAVPAAGVHRYCMEQLGARAPQHVLAMREMPRNPAGKVDKRALARLVAEQLERGRRR